MAGWRTEAGDDRTQTAAIIRRATLAKRGDDYDLDVGNGHHTVIVQIVGSRCYAERLVN
jgi:hypothetical protein